MSRNRKKENNKSIKEVKFNKENYYKKLLKKKKEEDWFCYNCKKKKDKWKRLKTTTIKKFKKEKEKVDKN